VINHRTQPAPKAAWVFQRMKVLEQFASFSRAGKRVTNRNVAAGTPAATSSQILASHF
jgi:hypothetical protein